MCNVCLCLCVDVCVRECAGVRFLFLCLCVCDCVLDSELQCMTCVGVSNVVSICCTMCWCVSMHSPFGGSVSAWVSACHVR